jgi:hypothetical protein
MWISQNVFNMAAGRSNWIHAAVGTSSGHSRSLWELKLGNSFQGTQCVHRQECGTNRKDWRVFELSYEVIWNELPHVSRDHSAFIFRAKQSKNIDDWLTVHRSITLFDFLLDAQIHIYLYIIRLLTLRLLMSYVYGAPILDVSRSHTTTQHSRKDSSGRVISSSQRPLPDNTRHSQDKYPCSRCD